MRCKIVTNQKPMCQNCVKSTKSQKSLILHYSIDFSENEIPYVL